MATKSRKGRRPSAPVSQPIGKLVVGVVGRPWGNCSTKTSRISLDVHPIVYVHLCNLVKCGLFGVTPEQVAERLLCEGLRTVLRRN
jgi:hypothetical protein